MAKKQNYFIGKGFYTFEVKDYGYGELLPDAVPQETIDSMRSKGKVGDTPAQVNVVSSDESEALKAQLSEIKESAARWESTMDELRTQLADATKSAEELQVALEQAQGLIAERDKTVAELTAQLTAPGAAPAADTKAAKK